MKKYLLLQIEEYPALYRQDHPYFKEKTTTHRNAWEAILSTLKKKYDEELIAHELSTVTDLMGVFATLKAKLKQVMNASKTKTGMATREVTPITWTFYHSMEFLRQVSEPLPTQSSVDVLDISDTAEGSSSGPKWDPIQEKKRRSISAKETRKWNKTQEEKRKSKKHDEVMATLSSARSAVAELEREKEKRDCEGPKDKRQKVVKDDEDAAFFNYIATRTRQVLYYIFQNSFILPNYPGEIFPMEW